MSELWSQKYWLPIALLSGIPEVITPLWIMPRDIRDKAKGCNAPLVEELLDLDPYLARLWFVTADKQSGKKKMDWLINYYSRLKNIHHLRPNMLDELFSQVYLGFIPANKIGDIFSEIDGERTVGHIAYDLGLYTEEDIPAIVQKIINENPEIVEQYKDNPKVLGALVGKARDLGVTNLKEVSKELLNQLNQWREK